jgi:predicted lipid-binding transport protein (Tim44 family)
MNTKRLFSFLAFLSLVVGVVYLWHDTAQASRFGRGGSFGSKPSYQRSAQPPASTPGQTAQQKPGAVNTPPAAGRFGGMLGGLLMGGLIGSLLFGGGFAMPGLFDLLLIGGGLFLLMRFLRSRRPAAQSASPFAMPFQTEPAPSWGKSGVSHVAADPAAMPTLPPGFDADEFLNGAKSIYARLQTSWDKRDLDDIRQFTSPEVFEEIQNQAKEDPDPGKTELLLVDARIIEVREHDRQIVASVMYDVMMREDSDKLAKQVRELWHFSRDSNEPDAFWLLEGIQQVQA